MCGQRVCVPYLVVHLQSEDWRISANGRGVVKLLGWPKFVTKYAAGVT